MERKGSGEGFLELEMEGKVEVGLEGMGSHEFLILLGNNRVEFVVVV